MRNPDWTKDPKFSTHESRYKHHDEIDKLISNFTKNRDNHELFITLQKNGVPAGPVATWEDTHKDPQLNSRGFFQNITATDIGTYMYPGFPWIFSETPLRVKNPHAMVGEHNDYVYKQIIGLSDAEIKDLTSKVVLGDLKYNWAGPTPEHIIKELPPEISVL